MAMEKYNETFPPEAVDEQIEQSHLLPTEDARLVDALRQTYRAYADKNAQSLNRAWQRIQQYQPHTLPSQDARPLPGKPASFQRKRNVPMRNTPSRPGRWSGLSRDLSIAAAIIFVALLVGSMALVFNMASRNGHGATTANNTTISLAPTPSAPVPGIYISSMKDWNTVQISRLDKNSHQVVWSHNVELNSAIVVVGNTVYVSGGGGPNLEDNYVYALDATGGALRWRSDLVSHYVAPTPTPIIIKVNGTPKAIPGGPTLIYPGVLTTPAVSGNAVYVMARDGTVYALNIANGKTLWSYNTKLIAMVDGTIYDQGDVAVANGMVYATIQNSLFAIDAKSGQLLWSQQTDTAQVFTSPQVVDGAVYLSSHEVSHHHGRQTQTGAVYSYDAKSGNQNWKHLVDNWVLSSPTIVNGVVYFGSYDMNVYALKASDGSELWHYNTGGQIFDSPLVSNGIVYITEKGNADEGTGQPSTVKPALFAIDAAKGTKLWSQQIDISLQTIQDGVIYGGVFPRAVYALKASDGSVIWHQQYGPDLIDKTGGHNGGTPLVTVIP
jgi:outer membrane protein assembly factor BamB